MNITESKTKGLMGKNLYHIDDNKPFRVINIQDKFVYMIHFSGHDSEMEFVDVLSDDFSNWYDTLEGSLDAKFEEMRDAAEGVEVAIHQIKKEHPEAYGTAHSWDGDFMNMHYDFDMLEELLPEEPTENTGEENGS